MSSTPPPPRRHSSLEMTRVIPRAELAPKPTPPSMPPVSNVPGPTLEQLADVARAERDAEELAAVDAERALEERKIAQEVTDTMVPCPSCATCALCGGGHLVPPSIAVEWNEQTGAGVPSEEA